MISERTGKCIDEKPGYALIRRLLGLRDRLPVTRNQVKLRQQAILENDCKNLYSKLDVRGKKVLDIGSDFGTTPMYFISQGAKRVVGYSLEKQRLFDPLYDHRQKPFLYDNFVLDDSWVLKADCEGCEWDFTPEFLTQFDDFLILAHLPIRNLRLYGWLEENADRIISWPVNGKGLFPIILEFAAYRRARATSPGSEGSQ